MAGDVLSKPICLSSVPKRMPIRVVIVIALVYFAVASLVQLNIVSNSRGSNPFSWEQFSKDYELKRGRAPPSLLKYWLDYAQKHSCPLDQFESIYADLERFRHSSLTEYDVLSAVSSCPTCKLVKLENGKLFVGYDGERGDLLRWILKPAMKTPDLKFTMAVNYDDRPQVLLSEDASNKRPIMSWSVHKDGRNGDIRFPYDVGVFLWKPEDAIMWGMRDWKKRTQAVVWRGTSTGTFVRPGSNWRNTHRYQMISKFGRSGTVIGGIPADIGFTEILQCEDDEECETAKKEFAFGMRKKVPFEWFAFHQYVIDIDGNAFSARFAPLLRSGTVVLKAGDFYQWFHERISPWEHYIPVDMSLNDLDEKVAWAVKNPAKAEAIAHNAAETAAKILRDADFRCYAYRLVIEYAALFG